MPASDFFAEPMLDRLLETVPMLVPFRQQDGVGLQHVVHAVASHLSGSLHDLLDHARGMGGYENSWRAFQLELAAEELFFGRPLCRSTRQFSRALGVSATSPNSLTRMRGFLCLGPIGSASVGESPPPLETWTKDEVQKARVLRLFPLTDSLAAGHQIVGEQMARILLCDLYQRDAPLPGQSLKGPALPFGRLVDCRSVSEFAREVADRRAFGYPLTFGRAVQMVTAMGYDPAHCLSLGLAPYKYFPHIKYWDEKRHLKAKWNNKDYVELHQPAHVPSAAGRAAAYLGDICARIDELGLSYSRNLVRYREHGMPWLERCVERLPKGMPKDRAITSLTFLSCIGLIQNGDFVTFSKMAELERSMPVSQRHLQDLHILSRLLLIQNPAVWRFHESIPYKLVVPRDVPSTPARPRPPPQEERVEPLDVEEEEEQVEEQLVERIEPTSVPASTNSRWTNLEVGLIDLSPDLSHSAAYNSYVKRCTEISVSVRTFVSFKRKRQRLMAGQ